MKIDKSLEGVHTHTHTSEFNKTGIGDQSYKNGFKTIVENDRSFLMQKSGITLIALVVTIIVLIILAAVSLNLILGQNGIITRAQQASKETKLAAFKEQVELDIAAIITDMLADGKTVIGPSSPEFKEKMHDDKGYTVTDNGDGSITVEKDGGEAIVHPNWTVEVEGLPDQSGGTAIEPADTTAPNGVASYSTTTPTNGTVIVIIETDEPIITPAGDWTMVGTDQKNYTREYTMNVTNEIIEITDLAGNIGYVTINIANIDNTNPTGMASYSPEILTGGSVTVTITTNKEIQTPNGWTRQTATTYTKLYDSNWEEMVPITDLAGNTGSVAVAVTNIMLGATVEIPIVTGGLTPIKWNGIDWVDTTSSDPGWYRYIAQETGTASGGTSRWANVRTSNGSYLVWIPRYEYKITNGYHTNIAGTIDVNFISKGTTVPTSGYTIHPAFTNSGNGGLGELAGIWVGKFQSSNDGSGNVKIVPNVEPYTSIDVSIMFAKSQAFGPNNELTGYDTHMIKNTEWGAVAYLAHSKYGRNGTQVTINNHYDGSNWSTLKTGYAGYTVSDSSSVEERVGTDNTSTSGTFPYNNTYRGVLASTTGNIYGIYDMNGCAWECAMGVLNKISGSSGFSSLPAMKYYDNYTGYSSSYKGDGTYETSSGSGASDLAWFESYFATLQDSFPWIIRGGGAYMGRSGSMFSFGVDSGSGKLGNSFRVVASK